MNKFNIYITFIFIVKIIFIILAATNAVMKIKGKENKKIKYWKERFEFIFIVLMSILLIYLFSPRTNRINLITNETKLLLYLFGFILLITAKWNQFFHEAKWFEKVQTILGKGN